MASQMKRILLVAGVLLALAAAWLWWQRPRRVDLAAYAPADTLVYLETNDLPALVEGLTATEAWRLAGLEASRAGWLGRLLAWTGLGPADKVALARSQVAVAVLGAQTGADEGALKLKPSYAVVIETHTGAARVRSVAERRLDAFATRAYGQPRVARQTENDTEFVTWQAPDSARRLVAAFVGSVVVVGPDETAVRACLDARRGARPNLQNNAGLSDMRARMDAAHALAFGYVAPDGLGQIGTLAANLYAAPLVLSDPRLAAAINQLVPQAATQIAGGLGWSARPVNGQIEDRYFLKLNGDLAAKLSEPLAAYVPQKNSFAELLPENTYSFTQYNFQSPGAAWTGLNKGLAGQLDVVGAALVTRLLAAAWQPYDIDEPGRFLSVFDEQLATARLDEESGGAVVLHLGDAAQAKNQTDWLQKQFGPADAGSEKTWQVSGGTALFGPAERVRQCLEAQRKLAGNPAFQRAAQSVAPGAQVVTFTNDQAAARALLNAVAQSKPQPVAMDLPYAVSETRLLGDGFEKRTRSAFGLLGALAAQFGATRS
jgi:hypothetical protein